MNGINFDEEPPSSKDNYNTPLSDSVDPTPPVIEDNTPSILERIIEQNVDDGIELEDGNDGDDNTEKKDNQNTNGGKEEENPTEKSKKVVRKLYYTRRTGIQNLSTPKKPSSTRRNNAPKKNIFSTNTQENTWHAKERGRI